MFKRLSLAAATLGLTTLPAFAHLNPEEHGSFMAGFSHPLFGADHILVMVAVGIWAAQIAASRGKDRAVLIIPAAFVGTMAIGFLLALGGIELPFVEPAILASVIALGLLVAMATRVPSTLPQPSLESSRSSTDMPMAVNWAVQARFNSASAL